MIFCLRIVAIQKKNVLGSIGKIVIQEPNVIKIEALAEDGKPEEMSTSETVCSFS